MKQRLCPDRELAERQARGFERWQVFVLRHQGRLHAWRDACPHYGDTPLAWRRDAYLNADGSRIVCAAHGAEFEPATGLCVLGPCLGRHLRPVAVGVSPDGWIEIEPEPNK